MNVLRYWLFAGPIGFWDGGMHNYKGSFELLTTALKTAENYKTPVKWCHIYDMEEGMIIYEVYHSRVITDKL